MAVEGVNNSGNNAGLYALGAAAVGGGAGVGVAYMTKPYLKDGAPTDSFIKKIEEKAVDALSPELKQDYYDSVQAIEQLEKINDAEALNEFIKNNKKLQDIGMADACLEEIDKEGFEAVKKELTDVIDVIKGAKSEMGKDMFEASWDANKKEFVHDAENMTLDGFNAVKKAAKSIQGKYALIYGSIAAAVLGLGTFFAMNGKKPEQVPEKIDTQA